MPCDKIDCQLKIECFDAYGKFKYPPCASESVEPNADSLQQLKAKIADLATDLECHSYSQFSEQMYRELRKRLRQLSAV